jgi:murein DD-endopeptidase MepM/ murein hydrolase activator NlpD
MANEFYTFIVVPHAKARFRKIQVPVRLAKWAGSVIGILGLAVSAMLVHYVYIRFQVHEIARLRAENQTLSLRTKQYEENVGRLQAKVVTLQKVVDKLGVMAGLEAPPSDAALGGVGGAPSAEADAPALDPGFVTSMERKVTDLATKSATLESVYRDQKVMLASTPSVWPVRGYLSTSFGNRLDPFTGERDFHPGIDISTPLGTKISAPADGVVVTVAEKGGYGRSIVIDHGYGMLTRYGHLDRYNVRPGQRIKRGEVIGFVGSTGRSTAPHLHYEVWVRDQAQNPIHFILDEFRSFG